MDSKLYKDIGNAVKLAQKNGGTLTEQNLLYVVKIAADIANKTGADFDMLLGEGVIAMMKCEEKFDPTQSDSFVRTSAQAVRGYMLNAVNRQGSLVHIPVNHLTGFKKGQERKEETKLEYSSIDVSNYDTYGTVDDDIFKDDRYTILQEGLNNLDINGRIAIEMKLRLGKYSEMTPSEKDPTKMVYKYKNNIQSIADELEVPLTKANKIYRDAVTKLSKYCQAANNN